MTAGPDDIRSERFRGIPPLAGLTTLEEAQRSDWSVEASVLRLKRLHYTLKRLHHILTCRITAEPIYELKNAFSYHAYLCAEHVTSIRSRVAEMREPPLGLEQVPHTGLQQCCDEIGNAPTTEELVTGLYDVAVPFAITCCECLLDDAHPLADAPTARLARFALIELREMAEFGQQAIACLVDVAARTAMEKWIAMLRECLDVSGGPRGETGLERSLPPAKYSQTPYVYDAVPRRDERFIDPYNAGVNAEAFLYDERFSPRDKTLMMYYKRIRELDVPEMMASILHEMPEKPWEFHYEISRQLWDEARHAMMGEVGFAALGIDWRQIPINFTWSRNLNTQLNAQERHGVLFFIEQGLMPRTGKRFEWEVGRESGDPLAALFQDFDWADEVLHSQIGRRWYVTQFDSLNHALDYGDQSWHKVTSHWRDDRDQGRTEHRNWWPEIYETACAIWNVEPDPLALEFCETYEQTRADLKQISASG